MTEINDVLPPRMPPQELHITQPSPQDSFATTEEAVEVCGTFKRWRTKPFEITVLVKNTANGFATKGTGAATPAAPGLENTKMTRVARWCTSETVPLVLGTNTIEVRKGGIRAAVTVTRKPDG